MCQDRSGSLKRQPCRRGVTILLCASVRMCGCSLAASTLPGSSWPPGLSPSGPCCLAKVARERVSLRRQEQKHASRMALRSAVGTTAPPRLGRPLCEASLGTSSLFWCLLFSLSCNLSISSTSQAGAPSDQMSSGEALSIPRSASWYVRCTHGQKAAGWTVPESALLVQTARSMHISCKALC
jgi:hypothetical protein